MAEKLSAQQLELKEDLMARGDEAYDDGDFTLALDCYHRASVIDRRDPAVWCAVGMAYYNLDFNREAWRSYLLAYHFGPDRPDTLWYAAEFLVGVGDMHLAAVLLQNYLMVEQDEERQAEGRKLLAETLADLKGEPLSEAELTRINAAFKRLGSQDEGDLEASGPPELDPENMPPPEEDSSEDSGEPAEAEAEWAEAEEEPEADDEYYVEEGGFVAALELKLGGMDARCGHCKISLPQDAPFCYSCLMPHFYEEV